jgi:hypothetical protein
MHAVVALLAWRARSRRKGALGNGAPASFGGTGSSSVFNTALSFSYAKSLQPSLRTPESPFGIDGSLALSLRRRPAAPSEQLRVTELQASSGAACGQLCRINASESLHESTNPLQPRAPL